MAAIYAFVTPVTSVMQIREYAPLNQAITPVKRIVMVTPIFIEMAGLLKAVVMELIAI